MKKDIIALLQYGSSIPNYFSFENGRKNTFGDDIVILWHGVKVTMADVGFITWFLCKNEARIWPEPRFDGAKMFVRFMMECMTSKTFSRTLLEKFRL